MYLLIIQLHKTEYKEDVLLALTTLGIDRGSLIESTNLDQELAQDFPLFTGLVRSDGERARFSVQISAVVENVKCATQLMELLQEADVDITEDSIMRIMLLPMAFYADDKTVWSPEA